MNRKTQSERLLALLEYYASQDFEDHWVTLPRIMALQIASHTRRVSDLRKQGHTIICERETVEGQVRTKYKLIKENQ